MKTLHILLAGLSLLSLASGRSLQQAPVQAPAAERDAVVLILNPSGAPTAAVPIVDGSNLMVSPSGVTLVKPGGQVQAFLSLTNGNSTIRVQPSATSTGFITITQPNGPSAQVSLVPRAIAQAPGVPSDLATYLDSMPNYRRRSWGDWGDYDWSGSVDVGVDVSDDGSSGTVDVIVGDYSSTVEWGGDK